MNDDDECGDDDEEDDDDDAFPLFRCKVIFGAVNLEPLTFVADGAFKQAVTGFEFVFLARNGEMDIRLSTWGRDLWGRVGRLCSKIGAPLKFISSKFTGSFLTLGLLLLSIIAESDNSCFIFSIPSLGAGFAAGNKIFGDELDHPLLFCPSTGACLTMGVGSF